jgi:hypothetical protein
MQQPIQSTGVNPAMAAINKEVLRYSGRQLSAGGDKSPLIEFIARGVDWDVVPSHFNPNDMMMVFKSDQVQVIRLREGAPAYLFDTAEISVKHSGSEKSGFGFLQASLNKALGLTKETSDLEFFKNKMWHWTAVPYNWGKIPNSSVADANGDTWGDIWQLTAALDGQAPFVTSTAPVATIPTTSEVSSNTPLQEVYSLINGRSQVEWMPQIVASDLVRRDNDLFVGIMSNIWLPAQIASGNITQNADGTFTVVNPN